MDDKNTTAETSNTSAPNGKLTDSHRLNMNINAEEHPENICPKFNKYLLISTIWFTIIFILSNYFATKNLLVVIISVSFFSIPIILCGVYTNTITQIRRLNLFVKKGLFFKLLSYRYTSTIFWILWALISSFFVLIQFHTFSSLEWLIFFLVIPVYWLIFKLLQRSISHELKAYLVYSMALSWARRLCPVIMLLLYVAFQFCFAEIATYSSVQDAINVQKTAVADMGGSSAIIHEISQFLAFYGGLKAYALGHFGSSNALYPLLLLGIGNLVIFYNACAILSCFLIPATEYRRLFTPLSDVDQPEKIPYSRIATISAITTLTIIVIYVPIFLSIESYFRKTPEVAQARQLLESITVQEIEQIGEILVNNGTHSKLESARIDALRGTDKALNLLQGQVDMAFDQLEGNVDDFLDWYYSLSGEYQRIGNLLVGDLDDFMAKKLTEYLQQGDVFNEIQYSLENLFINHEGAQKDYRQVARRIVEENRIDKPNNSFEIVRSSSIESVLTPPNHQDVVNLQHRFVAGGAGGAATGVVTIVVIKKIMGKVVGKNLFKLAAKTLSKIVVSKTAGTAGGAGAGAAMGAAAGSIVPFFGTAAGAIGGGIIGAVVAALCVDKVLIELEEFISRDDFKDEILVSINEARWGFKNGLGL